MISHVIAENIEDIYEVSDVQLKMITDYKNNPGKGLHLMNLVFNYRGKLDVLIFKQCWEEIINKYSCFRTSFHLDHLEKPLQIVERTVPFSYGTIDLRKLDDKRREKTISDLIAEDRKKDFTVEKPLLMRLDIIMETDDLFKMWWRFPEMLMDGWNVPIIITEFLARYRSLLNSGSEPNGINPAAYRDYVVWLQQRDKERDKLFWQQYLAGFEPLIPDLSQEQHIGNSRRVDVDLSHLAEQLNRLAQKNEVTLNALFLGVIFLASITSFPKSKPDLTIGTTVADRPLALKDSQQRVGLYLNTLPLRCKSEDHESFKAMVRRFHHEMMALFEFTSSSEKDIKQWCDIPEDRSLFEWMIIFENMPVNKDDYEGLGFELVDYNFENRPSKPLNFFVWPGSNMNVKIIYDTALFSEAAITELSLKVEQLVELILQSDETPLTHLIHSEMTNENKEQQPAFA